MKAVLLLCVLVFLNIPVTRSSIFGCLCCGKKQEKNALQIFLGEGTKGIDLVVSTDCLLVPEFVESSTWLGIKEDGTQYNVKKGSDITRSDTIGVQIIPKDSCRVGLDNFKNNIINVISKDDVKDKHFKQCPLKGQSELQYQSFFLMFAQDMNTFMFLDPNKARWFFTSELGGCDIFVAIDPTTPDKPLVIHSNMNSITNDKANLEKKGNTVDMIMKFVPKGYKLKARVYHKSPSPDVREYMANYQSTHDIKKENIVSYDADLQQSVFYFFGYYTKSKWNFFIRAHKGGETYFVL